MHTIENKRLEECRKFLVAPGPIKDREELVEIVRDLTWAVEELQFRRLQDRRETPSPAKDDRPYILFGSLEAIVKFVDEHKIPNDQWQEATDTVLLNVLPRTRRARKLEGADETLWQKWEELCRTYESKTEEAV